MSSEFMSYLVSWFDFWRSLLMVALNLAENRPWLVPKRDGLSVAVMYFGLGQTSEVEVFAEIVKD